MFLCLITRAKGQLGALSQSPLALKIGGILRLPYIKDGVPRSYVELGGNAGDRNGLSVDPPAILVKEIAIRITMQDTGAWLDAEHRIYAKRRRIVHITPGNLAL